MKTSGMSIMILSMVIVLSSASARAQEGEVFHRELQTPRHIETICPPDYQNTRERITTFITRQSTASGSVTMDDLAHLSVDRTEVLKDAEDAPVCERLNQMAERMINHQVQMFAAGDPEYVYDVAYYKNEEFYFVVIDGGLLIQEDPDDPGHERIHIGGGGSSRSIRVYDRDLRPVSRRY